MNNYNYQSFGQYDPSYMKSQNDQSYMNNQQPSYIQSQSTAPPGVGYVDQVTTYSEEILNKNKGKKIKVYTSFSDSIEWRDKVFEGILEAWGRDFFLISDRKNNRWYMVWAIYIDYIEFNEEVIF
ncbi:MAG: spore coat protein GerQ [Bacilli bacterium]|nr:spore coat protein GerQ [Bacilli bacterium]